MQNPDFSVRFLLRADRSRKEEIITKAMPLRVRVWIASRKDFLYFTSPFRISRLKWVAFNSNGTPKAGADPEVIKIMESLRMAVGLAVNYSIAAGMAASMTSDQLKNIVDGLLWMIGFRDERAPMIGTSPLDISICAKCIFRGQRCRAAWPFQWHLFLADETPAPPISTENASDFAAFMRGCPSRIEKENGGLKWMPSFEEPYCILPETEEGTAFMMTAAAQLLQEGGKA